MKNPQFTLITLLLLFSTLLAAQKPTTFSIKSPDGAIALKVVAGNKLEWSVQYAEQQIIAPSSISMQLQDGQVFGDKMRIQSSKTEKVKTSFAAINYKKDSVQNVYTQLTLNTKEDYGVI